MRTSGFYTGVPRFDLSASPLAPVLSDRWSYNGARREARILTRISRTLAACLLAAPSLLPAQEQQSVYVGTPGEASQDLHKSKARELADSADDLREQISKRPSLALATHPEAADILITILDRRVEVRPSGQTSYGGGNTQSHYESRYILKYRLEAGDRVDESEYVLAGAFVTWKRMAAGIAKDIEQWVDDNSEQRAP